MWAKLLSPRITKHIASGQLTARARIARLSTVVSSHLADKSDGKPEDVGIADRPKVWLIFPGMGSQSNVLPKELYSLEPFAESLNDSRRVLKGIGIDMDELLRPDNPSIYTCIRSAMVSLSVLEIALYDTIKHVLPPELPGLIGHSAGDSICTYADGCNTAEQAILMNEACARALLATNNMSGGMAAIGLPWKTIQTFCPPDIYLSGQNSENSIMVSGPKESLKSFAEKLQEKGVFVRLLPTCGLAPHSLYVAESTELFREYLKGVLPNKKLRSSNWICTSALEKHWGNPEVQYLSKDYLANLLKNQVWFYQALLHIPKNSVVIEISPKATLGLFVKETVPSSKYVVPILKNNKINPVVLSKQNFQNFLNEEN